MFRAQAGGRRQAVSVGRRTPVTAHLFRQAVQELIVWVCSTFGCDSDAASLCRRGRAPFARQCGTIVKGSRHVRWAAASLERLPSPREYCRSPFSRCLVPSRSSSLRGSSLITMRDDTTRKRRGGSNPRLTVAKQSRSTGCCDDKGREHRNQCKCLCDAHAKGGRWRRYIACFLISQINSPLLGGAETEVSA